MISNYKSLNFKIKTQIIFIGFILFKNKTILFMSLYKTYMSFFVQNFFPFICTFIYIIDYIYLILILKLYYDVLCSFFLSIYTFLITTLDNKKHSHTKVIKIK